MAENYIYETFYMPGEIIGSKNDIKKKYNLSKLRIGPGIHNHDEYLISYFAGYLAYSNDGIIWILSSQKKYFPKEGDYVIGIVSKARGDFYQINIGFNILANLPYLSFQNATKKFRPELKMGDIVYTKVSLANPDLDFELTCIDGSEQHDTLGPLLSQSGYLTSISTSFASQLLLKNGTLVKKVKSIIPKDCEVIVGMNGRVWVNSYNTAASVKVCNLIKELEKSK